VIENGGLITSAAGGTALNGTIFGDAEVQAAANGNPAGATFGDIVGNHGTENVFGTATGTTVNSGGTLTIGNGGSANNTIVTAGGIENVLAGGMDLGTTLNGGQESVFGTAANVVVNSGGQLTIQSGGSAGNAQVNN